MEVTTTTTSVLARRAAICLNIVQNTKDALIVLLPIVAIAPAKSTSLSFPHSGNSLRFGRMQMWRWQKP